MPLPTFETGTESSTLTVRRALDEAAQAFALPLPDGPASSTPELDARVLLSSCTGWSWAFLLAHPETVLPAELRPIWDQLVQRRRQGEPVAYLVGKKEFWGLEFQVGPGVLVPRPDTEILVEVAIRFLERFAAERLTPAPRKLRVLDVCTGSGCVAVALAHEARQRGLPCEVAATDLSPVAVQTARANVARLVPGLVNVYQTDLTAGLAGPWDLVVSNPPYLTTEETEQRLGPGQWKEPGLALDGGSDGLDVLRRLIDEVVPQLMQGACLAVEAADSQMPALSRLLAECGLRWTTTADLAGLTRVLAAELP